MKDKIRKYLLIFLVAVMIALTPFACAYAWSGSGSQGSSHAGSGGAAGTWNYCSSPAFAFYIDTPSLNFDQFNGQPYMKQIENSIEESYRYKYPGWAPGTTYVYILPCFETTDGTGNSGMLKNVSTAMEVNGNYTYMSETGDNVYHIYSKSSTSDNWAQDGRTDLYNFAKAHGGNVPVDSWEQFMSADRAKLIASELTSGGFLEYKSRVNRFIYADSTQMLDGYSESEKAIYQRTAYITLLSAFYQLSSNASGAQNWKAQINRICSGSDDSRISMPVFCADTTAIAAPHGGGTWHIFDAPDFYQYGLGMRQGAGRNLREGAPAGVYAHSWDTAGLTSDILKNLDSVDPNRRKPLSNYNIDGYGSTVSLIGLANYMQYPNFVGGGRHNLWSRLSNASELGTTITYSVSAFTNPKAQGRQDIYTDEPKKVTLPKGTTTIGQNVPIKFEVCDAKKDWSAKFLKALDDLENKFEGQGIRPEWHVGTCITREITDDNGNKIADTDNSSIISKDDQIKNVPIQSVNDSSVWENCMDSTKDYNEFKTILSDTNGYFLFEDQTSGDSIKSYKRYDYKSVAYIRIKMPVGSGRGKYYINDTGSGDSAVKTDKNGWIKLVDDDGVDYKEFTINQNLYHYDSTPEAYSEVKEGSPMNEEWEAMSGTPTTRPLYFASGGSEFAVTIDATPMHGTMYRKYSIHYPSWSCHGHTTKDGDVWYHTVGSKTDKWTQRIDYDYMRINTAKVWRVKESAVTGMKSLTPMNSDSNGDVVAQIVSGDDSNESLYTSIFHDTSDSIDGTDRTGSGKGGRIRFSEQPEQLDEVEYDVCNSEGSGDMGEGEGSCGERHSIPKGRRRDTNDLKNKRQNDAYVQSDYLVLHTKEGDMIVSYSETSGHADNLYSDIECSSTPDKMWWNNPLSPVNWSDTEINTFWYNGQYQSPSTCFNPVVSSKTFKHGMFEPMKMHYYESNDTVDKDDYSDGLLTEQKEKKIDIPTGNDFNEYTMGKRFEKALGIDSHQENYKVEDTKCDDQSIGKTTGSKIALWRQFNPLLTYKNGEYDIGHSSILYERILNYYDDNIGEVTCPLDFGYVDRYGSGLTSDDEAKYDMKSDKSYLLVHSAYSPKHTDCNNIVIHDPVSSEYSYVISLPESRDQRTDASKTLGSNAISSMTSVDEHKEKMPNPDYHNNLVFNGFVKSEKKDDETLGIVSHTGTALGWNTVTNPVDNDCSYSCDEDKGIIIDNNGSGTATYYQDIEAIAGDDYVLSYNVDGKAKVTTKFLDNNDKEVDSAKVTKIRILITQDSKGKSVINEVKLIDKSRAGLTPNNTLVYDTKTVVSKIKNEYYIDTIYHYIYKNEETGKLFDSTIYPGSETTGDMLVNENGDNGDKDTKYSIRSFKFNYVSTATTTLEDALIKQEASTSGKELVDKYKDVNEVVGKVFNYVGGPQLFMAPEDGDYFIEAYGANGGDSDSSNGAEGSHQSGIYHMHKYDIISIYVGGKGLSSGVTTSNDKDELIHDGGYNGGGLSLIGAGSGGGSTDVRLYTSESPTLEDRILVAGGGGGAGQIDSTAKADKEDGHEKLNGESNIDADTIDKPYGAGGGGYYGGLAETDTLSSETGSDYINTDLITPKDAENRYKLYRACNGNGVAQVIYMKHYNNNTVENSEHDIKVLSEYQYNNTPPDEAFIEKTKDRHNTTSVEKIDGNSKVDTFINLDYGFSIYFPNEGDFEGDSSMHGIANTTERKGLGFKDEMDTTEWTYAKYVVFPFDVINRGTRYQAGEKIYLDVNKEYFDFYCVLGNNEQSACKVKMVALAVNDGIALKGGSSLPLLYKDAKASRGGCANRLALRHPDSELYKTPIDDADESYILDGECDDHTGHYKNPHDGECLFKMRHGQEDKSSTAGGVFQTIGDCYDYKMYETGEASVDNDDSNNYTRYGKDFAAKHSGLQYDVIDVVGRIGNYIIDDTGDPRFANFFKKSDGTGNYILPGIVPTVDQSKQNFIKGDMTDIRGVDINSFDSNKPNTKRGNSSKTFITGDGVVSSILGEPYRDNWMNMQGEPKRPGDDNTGDSGNDPLNQTSYNALEVLGEMPSIGNAFLNTYARQNTTSQRNMFGLHDNEFGQLPYKSDESNKSSLPLTPDDNNIKVLRDQALRLGYPIYQDLQTLGNYYRGSMQITPTYYALDLDSDPDNPTIIPVDIYMSVDNSFYPINLFGAAQVETQSYTLDDGTDVPGRVVSTVTADKKLAGTKLRDSQGNALKDTNGNVLHYRYVYDNRQFIDWDAENIRRNADIGDNQRDTEDTYLQYTKFNERDGDTPSLLDEQQSGDIKSSQEWCNSKEVQLMNNCKLPFGMYKSIGNNQLINLDQRCRTYIGDSSTYASPINRVLSGNRYTNFNTDYDPRLFMQQGQRWHFTNNLPSSAVAIKAGSVCNSINIKELRKDNFVLLNTIDAKAIGSVWTLQYEAGGNNSTVDIYGKKYTISGINKGKVVAVTSIDKSSKDDMNVSGTH